MLDLQVNILARRPFWPQNMVPKKVVLWRNDFVVGFEGNPSCPNEFYGPWDAYGQATLPPNPFKK